MAREIVSLRLSVKVNKPLAYAAVLLKFASDWLLNRAVKVIAHGT